MPYQCHFECSTFAMPINATLHIIYIHFLNETSPPNVKVLHLTKPISSFGSHFEFGRHSTRILSLLAWDSSISNVVVET